MDTTPLGFPYPECDPPRVKDISDIGQLKDLAEAIDGAVQTIADDLNDQLVIPLGARMRQAAPVASLGNVVDPFLDQTVFASPGMADLVSGGIRITQRGWYLVGTYSLVAIAAGTEINSNTAILRNGSLLTHFGIASRLVTAASQDPYVSTVAQLEVGDLLRPRSRHSGPGATAYTTTAHMWAHLILGN